MRTSRLGWVSCLLIGALACAVSGRALAQEQRTPAAPPQPSPRPVALVERFETVDQPLNLGGATGEVAEWLRAFGHEPERFAYTLRLIEEEEGWRAYRLTFPSPVVTRWPENNTVPCELYLPKRIEGKVPAAIVLDILHGSAVVPRGLARGLAEQGVAAMYVPMACYGPRRPPGSPHLRVFRDDPAQAIDNVRQTVKDVRRAKAILASRPEVDPDRLAITGVSLGGIMTALSAGVDGGFHRVVPILAGGDLAAITFHARETRLMRAALVTKGMTREQAEKLMAPVEPLHFAFRIPPETCLMINASRDEVIPRETTEALHKAIGSPQILWAPAGHYSAVFFLPNIRQRTIDFILGRKVEGLDFRPAARADGE